MHCISYSDDCFILIQCNIFHNLFIPLQVIGSPRKGQQFQVEVRFTNPLATRLTGCRLFLEGPGIQKELNVQIK